MKLTTHLHLVPRSKNAWSYTSTPPLRLHGVVLSRFYVLLLKLPLFSSTWNCHIFMNLTLFVTEMLRRRLDCFPCVVTVYHRYANTLYTCTEYMIRTWHSNITQTIIVRIQGSPEFRSGPEARLSRQYYHLILWIPNCGSRNLWEL
jgi:hypothetical protein